MIDPNHVVIHFCRTCGFGVPAEQIANELHRQFELKVDCRAGFWGCFRIELNGQEIYNRWKSRGWLGRLGFGRTPTVDEIVQLIDATKIPRSAPP